MKHGFVRFRQGSVSAPAEVDVSRDCEERLLIVDLEGERGSTPLRNRLAGLEDVHGYDTVILRGMRSSLSQFDDAEKQDLIEAFGRSCRVCSMHFSSYPTLEWLEPADDPRADEALYSIVQEVDVLARLMSAEAVWAGADFHFALPSGVHTDTFIRVGDALGSPTEVARLADWIHYQLPPSALLVIDSATMLPLAQELRVRHLSQFAVDLAGIVVLPVYAIDEQECDARLLMAMPASFTELPSVVSLVSVTSTGGYLARLKESCLRIGFDPPHEIIVCESSPVRSTGALCHVLSEQNLAANCGLCSAENSHAVEIDAVRFAPRLYIGQQVQEIPRASSLSELRELLEAGTRTGAFRVHVTDRRTDKHSPIYIDVERLLADRLVRERVSSAIADACDAWNPEIIVVDSQCDTSQLRSVVTGVASRPVFILTDARTESLLDELRTALATARSVLIIAPCVASTRSVRSIVEALQRAAGNGSDLHLFCWTVLLRTSSLKALRGIQRRFYINRVAGLRAAWEVFLPSESHSSACPWCSERRFIESKGLHLQSAYFAERLQRLASPDGLSDCVFLLAHANAADDDGRAATHATPGAYFGAVSDVAAFVGSTAVIAQAIQDWSKDARSLVSRLVFSLPDVLRAFSDPMIAAAFLRAFRRREIETPRLGLNLAEAMNELAHSRQHDVFVAEMLLATGRGLIDKGWHSADWLSTLVDRDGEVSGLAAAALGAPQVE